MIVANDRQYDNTNRGTLGKNKNKDPRNPDHDKKPDYSGKINIDGRDYWLSGWLKEAKDSGEKFFSLSVQPKDERRSAPPQYDGGSSRDRQNERSGSDSRNDNRNDRGRRNDFDDEIPF